MKRNNSTKTVQAEVSDSILQKLGRQLLDMDQRVNPILDKYGLLNPSTKAWHAHRDVVQMIHEVASGNNDCDLYATGAIVQACFGLSDVTGGVDMALAAVDDYYQSTHRGPDAGGYQLLKWKCGTISVTCNNPYPCDFDRGMLESLVKRFAPPGTVLGVAHDHDARCRDLGDHACTYKVELMR